MHFDYSSLLVAVVFCGIAMMVAALTVWRGARMQNHLLLSAIGLGLLTVGVALLSVRDGVYTVATLIPPFFTLLAGLGFVHAGARRLVHNDKLVPIVVVVAVGMIATALSLFAGFMALGYVIFNVSSGLILVWAGIDYFTAKDEMRSAMIASGTLYVATGLSFAACAIPITMAGDWINYPILDNWADSFNAGMSLAGISGIGALTLSIHFARAARHHQAQANTDVLTGVLNRRALFDRYPEGASVPNIALLLFDLDHFKLINDRHGHAAGDIALQKFGDILQKNLGPNDLAARVGGEEFCMVLPGRNIDAARIVAERIRNAYAALGLLGGNESDGATVSVGIATAGDKEAFGSVLSRADAALYKAKETGRNRTQQADPSLAVA